MNLYETNALEKHIEQIAAENEGEISDEQLQQLVEAQTKSVQQIEGLCKYVRNIGLFSETCDAEINRIKSLRERADKRIDGIKKYLTPYISAHGKVEAGTFTLSIRKSEAVKIINETMVELEYQDEIPVSWKMNKDKIKKAIKAGIVVAGAELEVRENLQIK
jgi:hypothetical protein